MLQVLAGLALTAALTLTILLSSRFWIWTAPWDKGGLFAQRIVSPDGDLVRSWLGGTWLQDFDILIWGIGTLAALSLIHWFKVRLFG